MIIELDKQYGQYKITPELNETCENIACAIIISVYNKGQVLGLGALRAYNTELTKEMATKMLNGEDISHDYCSNPNEKNNVYMDYVFGRCCKTSIKIKNGMVFGSISTIDQNPEKVLNGVKELLNNWKE